MDRRTFLRLMSLGAVTVGAIAERSVGTESPVQPATTARNWTWTGVAAETNDEQIKRHFAEIRDANIQAVLLRGQNERTCCFAREQGLQTHVWMWTLCRSDQELREKHPEWYAVSRLGKSTLDSPPYVGYYRFLCPSREGVRRFLVRQVAELAALDHLDGVHLDYVRYPDVILPVGLWEKYDLVQNEELPQFDFCYCEVCREKFREQSGIDPLELDDPPADPAWRRFRYDSVTRLVNELVDVVHEHGKQITAAVFPTPDIARTLVRQDWTSWRLDAVLPMVYHHFYEQDIAWIEQAVSEGVAALSAERPLYAGLYLPSLKTDEDFVRAVAHARAGGARGVSLFGGVRSVAAR